MIGALAITAALCREMANNRSLPLHRGGAFFYLRPGI